MGGGATCLCLQLPLMRVLEAKHGDMEHATTMITKGFREVQSLAHHTLHKAKSVVSHVCESGTWPRRQLLALRDLTEQLVPDHFPLWLHAAHAAAGGDLAGADMAILAKPDPHAQLVVEVGLTMER